VELLRITVFKCCNSELQIKRKRRQLRWPNAFDHREVIQNNGVAALARKKHGNFPGEGQMTRHQNRLIHVLFTIICLNANIHDTRFAVLKKISRKNSLSTDYTVEQSTDVYTFRFDTYANVHKISVC